MTGEILSSEVFDLTFVVLYEGKENRNIVIIHQLCQKLNIITHMNVGFFN